MTKSRVLVSIAATASFFILSTVANATSLNTELLINGNAETGTTAGWTSTGIEVVASSSPGSLGVPVGMSLGNWVFTGGTGDATSQSLLQTVNIADLGASVDAGALKYSFSILVLSKMDGTIDYATGQLRFLNSGSSVISSIAFGDDHILNQVYDWSFVTLTNVIPSGTRSIQLFLDTSRSVGLSSDGSFDNASLILSAVPEPNSLKLAFFGYIAVAFLTFGRNRTQRIDA